MDFDGFLRAVCPPLDLAWRKYRRRSARRRVLARMGELGISDFRGYARKVLEDPEEAAALADRIRVTVSRFLRERERWEILFGAVLPELRRRAGGMLRVWSAGCCGGEEPYTLAILWRERGWPAGELHVLATDVDRACLDRARKGVYGAGSLREVPPGLRERWFRPGPGGWELDPEIRQEVRFALHNLQADPPPREMDLVLCRYLVFTYYRGRRRLAASRKLWEALKPGGALVIGRKEGLGPAEEVLFTPWPGAPGVYRKRG